MISKKRDNPRLAAIVIPGDERDGCVKVVLFHFAEESFVVDIPIALTQPRIVDRKVCVMMKRMPASFASAVADKHHCGSDSEKLTYELFSARHASVGRHGTSHEYLKLLDRSLDEYR